ncbi:MAG: HD domain-containing protein [Thermoanaerobaculia bacterium]|mgnify:CR=1 FL=1
MSTLERAIAIAAEAHSGEVDKAGQPYILHPLRVMLRLATPEERIVAVLHDVLEDTTITREELRAEGFGEAVIEALDSVTKRVGEDYEPFVRRAAGNPIGRRVKLADLADNTDRSRLPNPTSEDEARFAKYERAMEVIRRCPE